MLPYTRGLIGSNNYGIVKTETVFGFGPKSDNYLNSTFNGSEPLEWLLTHGNFKDPLPETLPSGREGRSLKNIVIEKDESPPPSPQQRSKKLKKIKKRKGKKKKCFIKLIKGKKKGKKYFMDKKYLLPLILGLLAAKSLLIPIALKALALLSTKGLIMGVFSTIMASVLGLKSMLYHSHGYQNRKDDSKTQVEIIQLPPTKSEDHHYYDDHYRRGDTGHSIPMSVSMPSAHLYNPSLQDELWKSMGDESD